MSAATPPLHSVNMKNSTFTFTDLRSTFKDYIQQYLTKTVVSRDWQKVFEIRVETLLKVYMPQKNTRGGDVKVKYSRYRPNFGPEGGQRYSSTLPLPRHQKGMSGQQHAPAVF